MLKRIVQNRVVFLSLLITLGVLLIMVILRPWGTPIKRSSSRPSEPGQVLFTAKEPDSILIASSLGGLFEGQRNEITTSDWALLDRLERAHGLIILDMPMSFAAISALDQAVRRVGDVGRGMWFIAVYDGPCEIPTIRSHRVMVHCSFQSIIMGHRLEVMTASSAEEPKLIHRLASGSGVAIYIVILTGGPKDEATDLRLVKRFGPNVWLVTADVNDKIVARSFNVTLPGPGRIAETSLLVEKRSARQLCALRSLSTPSWTWSCVNERDAGSG